MFEKRLASLLRLLSLWDFKILTNDSPIAIKEKISEDIAIRSNIGSMPYTWSLVINFYKKNKIYLNVNACDSAGFAHTHAICYVDTDNGKSVTSCSDRPIY